MKRVLSLAALALVLALGAVRAQDAAKKDMKPDEKSEEQKLAEEMLKEAKRFLASVKISARDAVSKAAEKQPGVVIGLQAEQNVTKDKDGKETKVDVFQVVIVKDEAVFVLEVDPAGKVTSKPAMEDRSRDAKNELKRLVAAGATISIPIAIEKLVNHEKASVISCLVADREDRMGKKGEGYLVYALAGDAVAWYEVDATTGTVEKRKN